MAVIASGYCELFRARKAFLSMEINQIRYFLAVANKLNFTSAAKECAVSQPALSKAIRKLEDNLGGDLFERDKQKVELTDFGRTMRIHFERIDDNLRKASEAAQTANKARIERLNIGVMCTIGPHRFSNFLHNFRVANPNIEITLHDVTASSIPELLLAKKLDCAICARNAQHDTRFQAIELYSETMVVAFSTGHRFADFDEVHLAQVANEPYLDRLHCEFRDDFLSFTKASGLELNIVLRSEREDWILDMLQNGTGISVLPTSSVMLNMVAHKKISDLPNLRRLELVLTRSEPVSSALAVFRDAACSENWQ